MEEKIDVKQFMKKCKEIRNVKEYLQDKSEEEIDQLKIDLLRKKVFVISQNVHDMIPLVSKD